MTRDDFNQKKQQCADLELEAKGLDSQANLKRAQIHKIHYDIKQSVIDRNLGTLICKCSNRLFTVIESIKSETNALNKMQSDYENTTRKLEALGILSDAIAIINPPIPEVVKDALLSKIEGLKNEKNALNDFINDSPVFDESLIEPYVGTLNV